MKGAKVLKKNFKIKIAVLCIVSLILSNRIVGFAGQWIFDPMFNGYRYVNDEYVPAFNCWRWIDSNGDNIAECYRFGLDGLMLVSTVSNGRELNDKGQWVIDGVVQQIQTQTYKILTISNDLEFKSATSSNTVIHAANNDMMRLMKENAEKYKDKNSGKKAKGDPFGVFSPSNARYLVGKKANILEPKMVGESNTTIAKFSGEEAEPIYLEEGEEFLVGRDMKHLVSASDKFKKTVKNVKIYGGDTWEEAMCLQGNGAFVKFNVKKYNFLRMEVAHQTHNSSTDDTVCYLEMYVGNELVTSFDSFLDGPPEIIEEYFDDEDKTVTFKLVIEKGSKGRKVYIRNARARFFKS